MREIIDFVLFFWYFSIWTCQTFGLAVARLRHSEPKTASHCLRTSTLQQVWTWVICSDLFHFWKDDRNQQYNFCYLIPEVFVKNWRIFRIFSTWNTGRKKEKNMPVVQRFFFYLWRVERDKPILFTLDTILKFTGEVTWSLRSLCGM